MSVFGLHKALHVHNLTIQKPVSSSWTRMKCKSTDRFLRRIYCFLDWSLKQFYNFVRYFVPVADFRAIAKLLFSDTTWRYLLGFQSSCSSNMSTDQLSYLHSQNISLNICHNLLNFGLQNQLYVPKALNFKKFHAQLFFLIECVMVIELEASENLFSDATIIRKKF